MLNRTHKIYSVGKKSKSWAVIFIMITPVLQQHYQKYSYAKIAINHSGTAYRSSLSPVSTLQETKNLYQLVLGSQTWAAYDSQQTHAILHPIFPLRLSGCS